MAREMVDVTIAGDLFDIVDSVTHEFVNAMLANVYAEITPIASIGVSILFLVFGFMVAMGSVEVAPIAFAQKSFRVAVITSIALAGGLYQASFADSIMAMPTELTTLLLPNDVIESGSNIIDDTLSSGFSLAAEAYDNANIYSSDGWAYLFYGGWTMALTVLACIVGFGALLLVKIIIAILVALGPIFILALLFESTKNFFVSWLGEVINYVIVAIVVAAVFGLLLTLFRNYLDDVNFDSYMSFFGTLGSATMLGGVIFMATLKIPQIASSLSRGLALDAFTWATRGGGGSAMGGGGPGGGGAGGGAEGGGAGGGAEGSGAGSGAGGGAGNGGNNPFGSKTRHPQTPAQASGAGMKYKGRQR